MTLLKKSCYTMGTEPVFVLGRMLLGKLDSDSDSDCPDAPSGYKPRRLSLSDLDVECDQHDSRPFSNTLELAALSSSSSLLNEHQNKAVQFLWELLCRREGGVLVCCII
jgi:hypothetical protein